MAKFENLFLWSRAKFKKDPQTEKNRQAIEKNRVSIEANKRDITQIRQEVQNDITQIRQDFQNESGIVAQNQADINLLKQADADLQVAMSGKANTNQVVNLNDRQIISGEKNFTALPKSGVIPTANEHLANKQYVDSKINIQNIQDAIKAAARITKNDTLIALATFNVSGSSPQTSRLSSPLDFNQDYICYITIAGSVSGKELSYRIPFNLNNGNENCFFKVNYYDGIQFLSTSYLPISITQTEAAIVYGDWLVRGGSLTITLSIIKQDYTLSFV